MTLAPGGGTGHEGHNIDAKGVAVNGSETWRQVEFGNAHVGGAAYWDGDEEMILLV